MFSTTASVKHVTPVPAGIPAASGIALLQRHDFFIECDPHMIHYEPETLSEGKNVAVPTDRGLEPLAGVQPKCYVVTDRVHTLPAGLWDSDVNSHYEFVDIPKGVFMRIRSPLGVVMESVWEVRAREGASDGDGEGFDLVEDIVIRCPRLLMGTVKSTCESGWQGIHDKMIAHLRQENALP